METRRSCLAPTHPRVCGEHIWYCGANMRAFDSPPRVRGAHPVGVAAHGVGRLTPACAGSTSRRRSGARCWSTHPRVCGEHPSCSARRSSTNDSPPRVRGAPSIARSARPVCRLTPACAGSTCGPCRPLAAPTTHPRVCGEHEVSALFGFELVDSPPRVRGARRSRRRGRRTGRLTPACAGSTSTRPGCGTSTTTHPRVCGEHDSQVPASFARDDSPPRVRGARAITQQNVRIARLTPACAGSTARCAVVAQAVTTHPRVCGEHEETDMIIEAIVDSPPRVRGAHRSPSDAPSRHRLTPACAGSTPCGPRRPRGSPTHPRVCGEHARRGPQWIGSFDSPPRVRGAP